MKNPTTLVHGFAFGVVSLNESHRLLNQGSLGPSLLVTCGAQQAHLDLLLPQCPNETTPKIVSVIRLRKPLLDVPEALFHVLQAQILHWPQSSEDLEADSSTQFLPYDGRHASQNHVPKASLLSSIGDTATLLQALSLIFSPPTELLGHEPAIEDVG